VDAFISHALSVFMGFFAIMNPTANTPVFLGLRAEDDSVARRKIAAKALILAVIGVQMLIQGIGVAVSEFQKMGVG